MLGGKLQHLPVAFEAGEILLQRIPAVIRGHIFGALRRALPTLGVDGAAALGLVETDGGQARPAVEVRPHAAVDDDGTTDWWLVSDLGDSRTGAPLRPDHVLGAGGASTTLARSTVRTAVARVWHESGYPAHGDYRDSNRLTARAHALWANDGTLYDPERAAQRARTDAADFVAHAPDGAVVAFDTELFGHHWHEGIAFLQAVLELAHVLPVAVGEAEPAPDAPPTSWGLERDLRTWSRGPLAWTQRSAELAALGADPSDRALRELLALQSSDWAFLIDRGTAGDYPRERAEAHHRRFVSALAGQGSDELRNMAPELANWAFVQP